ncbi:MAG: ELM1/GtrOC1 family putative glycosyltransferase, partial [Candidatus Tisiphia sp.]
MHPNLPFKQFDLIILPHHDKVSKEELNMYSSDLSILRITGALNNVQEKIQDGGIELRKNYPKLGKFISVIIGGNSKNYTFTDDNARQITTILSNLIQKGKEYNLFISFSRRTPNSTKEIIKNNVSSFAIIYDPTEENAKPNPYFGMLSQADYIISHLRKYLREDKIGYKNLVVKNKAVQFELRNLEDYKQVKKILGKVDREITVENDNTNIKLSYSDSKLAELRYQVIAQSIEIIRMRVDSTGTTEPNIQ